MSPYDFFRLVERMRDAQREYFRTRDLGALRKSKNIEMQVDNEIYRVRCQIGYLNPDEALKFNNKKP